MHSRGNWHDKTDPYIISSLYIYIQPFSSIFEKKILRNNALLNLFYAFSTKIINISHACVTKIQLVYKDLNMKTLLLFVSMAFVIGLSFSTANPIIDDVQTFSSGTRRAYYGDGTRLSN